MTELGHLLLADMLLKRLDWPREMRSMLYLGAIAPDAHRTTIDVSYRDVHFRSSNRQGYRLIDFLRDYLRPTVRSYDPEERGFFLGWLCHLCADDAWRAKIRAELPSLWSQISSANRMERNILREEFGDECAWVDGQLYQRNSYLIEDIRWLLEQAPARFTIPPLQVGDIHRWRLQVIEEQLPPPSPLEQPRFLSLDFALEALAVAEEEVLSILNWENKKRVEEERSHAPGHFTTGV